MKVTISKDADEIRKSRERRTIFDSLSRYSRKRSAENDSQSAAHQEEKTFASAECRARATRADSSGEIVNGGARRM